MAIRSGDLFGQNNTTVVLSEVFCHGNEEILLLCPHNSIGQHNCDISKTAGVICGGILLHSVAGNLSTILSTLI